MPSVVLWMHVYGFEGERQDGDGEMRMEMAMAMAMQKTKKEEGRGEKMWQWHGQDLFLSLRASLSQLRQTLLPRPHFPFLCSPCPPAFGAVAVAGYKAAQEPRWLCSPGRVSAAGFTDSEAIFDEDVQMSDDESKKCGCQRRREIPRRHMTHLPNQL